MEPVQIMPDAVGQSDGTVVFWEENDELGVAWPQSVHMVDEVRFGIGSVNQEGHLILYLFAKEKTLECYLPEYIPTTPSESINILKLLCSWEPEVLKIRYGSTPADGDKEVTLLLPTSQGETLLAKLQSFSDDAEAKTANVMLLERIRHCLEENAVNSPKQS